MCRLGNAQVTKTVSCPCCGRPAGEKCNTVTGLPHLTRREWYRKFREEKDMSNVHTVKVRFLQMSQMTSRSTIRVDYSKQYFYLTDRADIKVGDYVAVWSPIFDGPSLCIVDEICWNTKLSMAYKYIIDRIDFNDYNNRMAAEAAEREMKLAAKKRIGELQQTLAMRTQMAERAFIDQQLQGDEVYLNAKRELDQLRGMLDS